MSLSQVPAAVLQDGSVTQAKLGSNVAGNGPAFSAFANSTTTVAHNTDTKVIFGGENFDTASAFDSVTNSRFQPQVAGYYRLYTQFMFSTVQANATSVLRAYLYKNGSSIAYRDVVSSANLSPTVELSALVYLNGSTDYVEVFAFQNTGASLSIVAAGVLNYFDGEMVRAA